MVSGRSGGRLDYLATGLSLKKYMVDAAAAASVAVNPISSSQGLLPFWGEGCSSWGITGRWVETGSGGFDRGRSGAAGWVGNGSGTAAGFRG